jgi:glycosyltransferase involved in cell wall biosynthesis
VLSQIAVVIPFRGELDHLKKAVNSVRESNFKDFRILVFDDNDQPHGRSDFLQEDEYFSTGGIGLPAVIEYSKSFISEEYVALLAGDDMMASSRLQLQMLAIRRENSEICLSRMRKFSAKHSNIEMLTGNPRIETFTKLWLLLGAYGADGTILMTNNFYQKRYVLDSTDSYNDWALALSNYPKEIAYVPEELVFYRQHEGQTTRKGRNDFLESGVYEAWRMVFEDFFKSTPPLESFQIIGAPWFRSKINSKDIKQSRLFMRQILEGFRSENFTSSEMNSLESLIIRRYIFRGNIQNVFSILSVLFQLKIRHVYIKLLIESIKVAKVILLQRDIRPRFVKLGKK